MRVPDAVLERPAAEVGLLRRAAFERVLEVIQRHLFFAVLDLQIADSRLQARRPVDQVRAAIDHAFLIQRHEGLTNRARQAGVQREALAIPVARSAQTPQLLADNAAILVFPLPGAAQELLTSQRLAGRALVTQHLLNLQLRGDAGVVAAGYPKGAPSLHALVADQQVFDADKHCVTEVQFARHVGRRDGNHERFGGRVACRLRLEPAVLPPPPVQPLLCASEIVRFGHIAHGAHL